MVDYTPIPNSYTPSAYVTYVDEPWRAGRGTQTMVFYKGAAPARMHGATSVGGASDLTFVFIDTPVLAGLDRLRRFQNWKDNWDAEGARAPDPVALDTASKVFSLLSVHAVPDVTLDVDGNPMLIFNAPVRGEVVVTSPQSIDYFFVDGRAPYGEAVPFDGEHLPQELAAYVKAFA